jgi:hypothetical protein
VSQRDLRRLTAQHVGMAIDLACPGCGTQMYAEQAHNRCPKCRYYEPCCDGAPQPYCEPAAAIAPASSSGRRVETSQ